MDGGEGLLMAIVIRGDSELYVVRNEKESVIEARTYANGEVLLCKLENGDLSSINLSRTEMLDLVLWYIKIRFLGGGKAG